MTTVTAGSTSSFSLGPFDTLTVTAGNAVGAFAFTSLAPKRESDKTLAAQNGTFGPWGVPMSVVLTVTTGSVVYSVNQQSNTVAEAAKLSVMAVGGNRSLGITNYEALRPWFQAVADAQNAPVLMQVTGDSIAFGLYADGTATATDAAQAALSMQPQLAKILNSRIGATATFSINGNDDRNTFSGAQSGGSVGLNGYSKSVITGQTITIACPACTNIDIIYYENTSSPQTGSCSYDWNSGAVTGTIAYGATANTYKKVTITVTAGTPANLVITGTHASNLFYVCQVNCYTGGGVIVGRNGRGSYTSSDVLGKGALSSQSAAGQARLLLAFKQGSPALNVLLLGHNDCTNQATVNQLTTPAVYSANLAAIAANDSTIPLLIVSEPDPPNDDSALAYKYRDYWAAARALAVPGSNIAHLSIADFWGAYATANANGYQAASSVHPSRKGYGAIANLLASVLSGGDPYRVQLLTGQ